MGIGVIREGPEEQVGIVPGVGGWRETGRKEA